LLSRLRAGHVRDRRALATGGANIASLALGYAIRLAVIPLSLRLLGAEQYGLWLAVGSLIAWGGMADLGLAPGLVNLVASACGRRDREAARRYISSALAAYTALAGLLLVVFIAASGWQGLPRLLGVRSPELAAQARVLVALCGGLFAATSVIRVIPTTCTALQEGYYGAWSQIAGSLAGLLLLVVLVWRGGSLLEYAVVMGAPTLAAQLWLGAFFFGRRHRDLRPSLRYCDRASLRALWGVGGWLTLQQAANLAVLYSANLIIANRLGAAAVPEYSVPYALFAVLTSVAWYIVSPYLPAYAEAKASGDVAWIGRRAKQALAGTVGILGLGGAVLVAAGPLGVRLWTGGQVAPARGLLMALACFSLLKACSNSNSVLLVGLGLVKFAGVVYSGVAALYVAGAWLLAPQLGILAIPIAGAAAHLLDTVVSVPYALRHVPSAGEADGAECLREAFTQVSQG
jgi:O-antigen/teichoic acid export membrane protein